MNLSYAEAYETVSEFIKSYNNIRIHSSLKYHTPAEAYKLLQQKWFRVRNGVIWLLFYLIQGI